MVMKSKTLFYVSILFLMCWISSLTITNSSAQYLDDFFTNGLLLTTNWSFPLNSITANYGLCNFGFNNNFFNFNQDYNRFVSPINYGLFTGNQLFNSYNTNNMYQFNTLNNQFNFFSPKRTSDFYSPQPYNFNYSFQNSNTITPSPIYDLSVFNTWGNIAPLRSGTQTKNENNNSGSGGTTIFSFNQPTTRGKDLAALTPVTNCDELLAHLKEEAIQEMEQKINENIEKVIGCGGCCYHYPIYWGGYYSGGYSSSYQSNSWATWGGEVDSSSPPTEGSTPTESATEYSTTNVQVMGVDEADFIKNDGSYIYILANNKFKIIDAWPPESAAVISNVEIEGLPKKLYIANDRALIYSGLGYLDGFGNDDECTYGYNCDFTGDNRKLKITIFDISDRTNPVLLREIRFGGSYLNSRRVGTAVHTVIFSPAFFSPQIEYWPELYDQCQRGYYPWVYYYSENNVYNDVYNEEGPTLEELLAAFEQLKQQNRAIIENSTIADWIPGIQDTSYGPNGEVVNENMLYDCTDFYETQSSDKKSFLTIFSLDIDSTEELHHMTIFGDPGAVYASPFALYISSRQQYNSGYYWFYNESAHIQEASTVHKFRLQNEPSASCEYAGSGVVKGKVLNQFSMDEYNGYLRIATTTGHVPSSGVHSTLSVLEESSGELRVIGQVDNIAPQEDIRSVRFDGPKGFIVTFKKTDPLFAFDLSNPAEPKIAGELKIPGYSTYLHLMDSEHLLTIGYDADDEGSFAWFQGIMLQIFDVSDMTAPCLLHKEVIGTRGSTSEAATNHLAFNYFPAKDLLAIPITICEGGSGGSYGTNMTFSGLIIYDVTVENGFWEHGRVSHIEPGSVNSYSLCSNWWTDSNTVVKRSIFMDDYVFSITTDQIKFDKLENMGQTVGVIDLQ